MISLTASSDAIHVLRKTRLLLCNHRRKNSYGIITFSKLLFKSVCKFESYQLNLSDYEHQWILEKYSSFIPFCDVCPERNALLNTLYY